jgi:hypothetical protein
VPTEEDLERIRHRRQKGWGLVKRAWLQQENIDEESRAYDPERDLAGAYEASVEQADETADRLRREAARVAEYAALVVQAGKGKEEIAGLEVERSDAQQSLARTGGEWKAAWAPPRASRPLTPRRMRAWARAVRKDPSAAGKDRRAEGPESKRLQGRIDEHRESSAVISKPSARNPPRKKRHSGSSWIAVKPCRRGWRSWPGAVRSWNRRSPPWPTT